MTVGKSVRMIPSLSPPSKMYIKDKDQCFGGKRNEPISAPRQWVGEGVNKHLTVCVRKDPLHVVPAVG